MINLRSKLTGICTGDQAVFIRRPVFEEIGGLPAIPLMEDVVLSKRLKKVSAPYVIGSLVHTSARRWEEGGVLRTILLMWRLRLAFLFGASPESLAAQYYK
jgi:hypothetical protein